MLGSKASTVWDIERKWLGVQVTNFMTGTDHKQARCQAGLEFGSAISPTVYNVFIDQRELLETRQHFSPHANLRWKVSLVVHPFPPI